MGLRISHLKLQKLIYYCQAYHLAIRDTPLFEEELEAWKYGPVVKSIYNIYKVYGNAIIATSEPEQTHEKSYTSMQPEEIRLISQVMDAYGHLSAISLMEHTHREKPWQKAFRKGEGTIIDKEIMKEYYKDFLVDPPPPR